MPRLSGGVCKLNALKPTLALLSFFIKHLHVITTYIIFFIFNYTCDNNIGKKLNNTFFFKYIVFFKDSAMSEMTFQLV